MNLNRDILQWNEQLPDWQSDLLRRVSVREKFSNEELEEILDMVLAAHGMTLGDKTPQQPIPATQADFPQDTDIPNVKLLALSNLQNVNAIEPSQCLEFAPSGLTIVFGLNGSGKSSYSRVLKQICRTVDRTVQILPNVFETNTTTQTSKAVVKAQINGQEQSLEIELNTRPVREFAGISVFDSRTSSIYVNDKNEISYMPSSLSVFQRLALLQTRLQEMIEGRKVELKKLRPSFEEFESGTLVKRELDAITASTDPDTVERLATDSQQDRDRVAALEKEIALLKTQTAKERVSALRVQAGEAQKLYDNLKRILDGLSPAKIDSLRHADDDFLQKQQLAAQLAKESFADEPLKGVGSAAWKTLWNAAKEFFEKEAYPDMAFPPDDMSEARCPLCQQRLSRDALTRFHRFHEFVSRTAESEAQKARETRGALIHSLDSLPLTAVEQSSYLKMLETENPKYAHEIRTLAEAASNAVSMLKNALAQHDWTNVPVIPRVSLEPIRVAIQSYTKQAAEMETLVEEDDTEKRLVEKTSELKELQARIQLKQRLDDVRRLIASLQEEQILDQAYHNLNTRFITRKQRQLAEKFVTEEFVEQLTRELEVLRVNHLPIYVAVTGAKGNSLTELRLAESDHRPEQVLSEGEQKAVALAFFLTEVNLGNTSSGLVLDDPVSSLDHERKNLIATRLVQEAAHRQVVIFTHDIAFYHALSKHAEAEGIPCIKRTVRRVQNQVGIADKRLPWIAEKVKRRVGILRDELQRIEKLERTGSAKYHYEATAWIALLRETWERAVEELLFKEVVQRFNPAVQTLRLRDVVVTEPLVNQIMKGMTETSAGVHDQPFHDISPPPTSQDLQRLLDDFIQFQEAIKLVQSGTRV